MIVRRSMDRRLVPCGVGDCRPYCRPCKRVVLASAGDGSQLTDPATSPNTPSSPSNFPTSPKLLPRGPQSAIAAPGLSSNNMVDVLRANRNVRYLRNESLRLGERRLVAFLTAVAFTTLAWYGQDLLAQLGRLTSLPLEDLQGLIWFVICFNAVSLVLPKSRYQQ